MTDISEHRIISSPTIAFCFIYNIALGKKKETSAMLFSVCGWMRKCFVDSYDGSKTSCTGMK